MFRTTRCASLLVGTLAALAGPHSTSAFAADAPVQGPHAIVAQSTKATAGTGRRPISQRIAASNLPLRAPSPPDCAQDACPDEAIAADIAPPAPEIGPPVATESLPPAPEHLDADTATDAHHATDAVADTAADAAPDTVAAPSAAPPLPSAPDAHADGEARETAVVNAAANDAMDDAPAVVVPVAAPAQPAPSQPLREMLLTRIKGALGTRPRASTPPAAGPGAAAAVPAPAPPAARAQSLPRPIPIQPDEQPAATFGQPTLADGGDGGATPDPIGVDDAAAAAPARLEFDVRESRSLVGEGEQIVMRIAVRNVGGETAERVTATLFFAEGIEPVQAIGQSAEVYPGEVRFEAVPTLSPGSSVDLLVTAVGTRPGSVTYRGELECRQLAGRIAREGAVTVRAKRSAQP